MDSSAHLNVFSDQERRYINQWVNSPPPVDGAFVEQLQFQGHNGCWQQPVHNSNSSTGSNISFVGSAVGNHLPKASQELMKTMPAVRNGDPHDHIMAERRRRAKLSQRFIALSAIVPGLKKTDKASVLGDTIKYLKQMQERVKTLEEEAKQKTMQSMVLVKKSHFLSDPSSDANCYHKSLNDSLPEVEARICDKNVLLRIHCEKRQGVVEQVLTELEKIHLAIVNTSVLSFGASSLNITIVAQMDSQFCKTIKDIVMSIFSSIQHVI